MSVLGICIGYWKYCNKYSNNKLLLTKDKDVAKNDCPSEKKFLKFHLVWVIYNFSKRIQETGEYFESTIYPVGFYGEQQWRLKLYPKGLNQESKDYISIYLELVCSKNCDINLKFKFSVFQTNRQLVNNQQTTHRFTQGKGFGFRKFISRNTLKDMLFSNDSLIIHCKGTVLKDAVNISDQSKYLQPEIKLYEDLSTLFESQKFSDVTVLAQGREFKVHKNILSIRSPVFEAMFEHDMKENNKNVVEITDVDHEVLQEMLRFIYTGRVSNLTYVAEKLLTAADKYELEGLKVMCVENICKNLSVENVIDKLILAEMHNVSLLKSHAIRFIMANGSEVMDTPEWESMIQTHPKLIADVCRSFADNQVEIPGNFGKRPKLDLVFL